MVKRAQKRLPEGFIAHQFKPGDERAREAGKKGGKRKGLWFRIKKRKTCSPKCPIYEYCPFAAASQKMDGRPCLLNRWDEQSAKKLIAFLEGHTEEYDRAILAFLGFLYTNILLKYGEDIKLQRKLLYDMINVRKAVFGEKKDIEVKADVAVDMEAILKKIKEEVEGDKE